MRQVHLETATTARTWVAASERRDGSSDDSADSDARRRPGLSDRPGAMVPSLNSAAAGSPAAGTGKAQALLWQAKDSLRSSTTAGTGKAQALPQGSEGPIRHTALVAPTKSTAGSCCTYKVRSRLLLYLYGTQQALIPPTRHAAGSHCTRKALHTQALVAGLIAR
jgi:hypothetical protein